MPAAIGADALLGLSIDDPSDIFSVGHPSLVNTPNYGFQFFKQVSHSGGPKLDMIDLAELDGPGPPRKRPGAVSVPFSLAGIVKAGAAVPVTAAQWGTPDKTSPDTGVKQYDWDPHTSLRLPRSLTALWYKGATTVPPYLLYGLVAPKRTISVSAGQVIKDSVTFAGIHHGITGISEVHAGCLTYAGCVVARGRRADAGASTDALYIKVTETPDAGLLKIKFRVGPAGDYGAEQTLYYGTVSKRQKMGGTQASDWAPAFDAAGLSLGADTCTDRSPYEIMFTGDVTGLAADDEMLIPVKCLIPGAGASPYTGTVPSFVSDCALNWADAVLTVGGSRVVSLKSFSLVLDVPWKQVMVVGSKVAEDHIRGGKYGAVLTFARDLLDRNFDDKEFLDSRVAAVVTMSGPLIGATAYRKSLAVTLPQMAVQASSDVPNADAVPEQVVLTSEDTDAGAAGVTIRAITDQDWIFNT